MGQNVRTLTRLLLVGWTIFISSAWIWARLEYVEQTLDFGVAEMMVAIVGCFLTIRVRGNLLGPALLIGASAGLLYDVGTAYTTFSLGGTSPLPLEHFAAWIGAWTGPIGFLTVSVLFVLFPEGRFIARRNLWIPFLSLPLVLTTIGAIAIWSSSTADLVTMSTGSNSGEQLPEYAMVNLAFIISLVGLVVPSAISLILRFWRSGPVQRQQIRWLAASAVFAPIFIYVVFAVFPAASSLLVYTIGLSTLPLAIGVAVTRYRLYDLDRVVSRSVTYAIVVGLLGSLFALVVVVAPGQVYADAPPWLVAASTLGVAALFNPIRRRVQGWVDRRFNRSQYDAQKVTDRFVESLRDRIDVDRIVKDWVGVVGATMQPATVAVWVRGTR